MKLMNNKTPLDDTSDEESENTSHPKPSPGKTEVPTEKPTATNIEETPKTIEYETYSIGSDIVKEAEDLQKGLDSALADL